MINIKQAKTFIIGLACSVLFTGSSLYTNMVIAQPVSGSQEKYVATTQGSESPLSVVNSPKIYLNRKITMNAKFDKFSTLGLDYKPAFKSSDEYISFLIKRDDTNFDIPLSEMKLFLKRDMAEKFIDLKTNDKILIVGTVFSDALGDAWIDVESITVTEKAPEKDGVK